jgi:hemolysin III
MVLTDFREPINAWSHGAGMMLALPVTWVLLRRCAGPRNGNERWQPGESTRFRRIKALCLLIFGVSLIQCYGMSALFHGAKLSGERLMRLQRLDHIGIYILIAGTYTPVAWALMRNSWRWGTVTTVWIIALVCGVQVWCGAPMPIWLSTLTYLAMGWGALFCYFELARTHSHRTLMSLPLGGIFYSIGAFINLARWPAPYPGLLGAHELFHFFVITGSACHVHFMMAVVIPAQGPAPLLHPGSPASDSLAPESALSPSRLSLRQPHFASYRLWTRPFRRVDERIAIASPPKLQSPSQSA